MMKNESNEVFNSKEFKELKELRLKELINLNMPQLKSLELSYMRGFADGLVAMNNNKKK